MSEARALEIAAQIKKRLSSTRAAAADALKIELLEEKALRRKALSLDQETRSWIVTQLKKIVELGIRKIAAKSTGKSEKIRCVNAIAHVANVLRVTLADLQADEIQ